MNVNLPRKWAVMDPENVPLKPTKCDPESPINFLEISLDHVEHQRFKINIPPTLDKKDNLKYTAESADYLLKKYFNEEKGRGLNIYNLKNGFFENSKTKYDSLIKKWKIENESPLEDSRYIFSSTDAKKTYIKSLTYDTASGNTEIEAETHHFSYSDIKKLQDKIEKDQKQFKYEYMGNFPEPEPDHPHVRYKDSLFPKYRDASYGPSPLFDYYPFKWKEFYSAYYEEDKKSEKRRMLKKKLTIIVKSRAQLINYIPDNEKVAIETLREMITETEFRKYLKYGFILVKGLSGYIYQIFRNNSHTKVWKKGKLIKEICVQIEDSKIPPTDNVIAHKILIETSEESFEKLGNVYRRAKAA